MSNANQSVNKNLQVLYSELAKMKKLQKASHVAPRLPFSSVEEGGLKVTDSEGNVVDVLGQKPRDGQVILPGKEPSQPAAPNVTAHLGTATVTWDGTYTEDYVAPDLKQLEVHASTDDDFEPTSATLVGTITNRSGGSSTAALEYGTWYFRLIAVTTSDARSKPSEIASTEVIPLVEAPDMQEVLADIDARYDGVITESGQLGARLDQAQEDLQEHETRLGQSETQLTDLNTNVLPGLKTDLTKAKTDLTALDTDLKNTKTTLTGVSSELGTLKNNTLPSLQTEVSGAKSRLSTAETEISGAKSRLSEAESELNTAFGELNTVDTRINTAKTQAAADAKAKADAVKVIADKAAADALKVRAEAISRGTDLVTNGTGLLGNNTNFSTATFGQGDQPPGTSGTFSVTAQTSSFLSDELIPVDVSKQYAASVWVKQANPGVSARFYLMLAPYDVEKLSIQPYHYMEQAGTRTTLAADLKPGDTKIQLTSSAKWNNSAGASTHLRNIIFWNYVDGTGKRWAAGEYSRNFIGNAYDDGGIVGNTITLRAAYNGALIPAGTQLSNGSSGGNYLYPVGNALDSPEWKNYPGAYLMGGVHTDITLAATRAFPLASSYMKIGVLTNRSAIGGTSRQLFTGFSFSDVTANARLIIEAEGKAQKMADEAKAAAIDAAKLDATSKADAAKAAAIAAAAADATAKKEQAEAVAAADAKAKADKALADAKADAKTKADAAQAAAIAAAKADASSKAEAAEAAAAATAAADAKAKADAAQAAALAAAKTYADAQAAGASSDSLAAAKADATAKADAAKAAAIAAAAADATAKKEAAEANAAADAKAKADKALADAKTDATSKANAAETAAKTAAAADATAKAEAAEARAAATAAADAKAKADAAKAAAIAAAKEDATAKADAAQQAAIRTAASDAQTKADAARAEAVRLFNATVSQGQNILFNGDYELGQEGWERITGRAEVAAGTARSGVNAMKMTSGTASVYPRSKFFSANDERSYYIEAWVRREGADTSVSSVGLVVSAYDLAGTLYSSAFAKVDAATISNTEWTKISGVITPTRSGKIKSVAFAPWIAADATATYYFDDMLAIDVTEAQAAQAAADKAIAGAAAAQSSAGSAQTTADNALTMAGSKGKSFYSTSAPSGTGTAQGDIWRRIDASKNVIGEWYWTGSAWQASQITTDVISNLDVGKLTAGSAVIQTAVVNKIAVATADVIELNASRITTGKLSAERINVSDLAAQIATIIQLNADRITAGTIATGRLNATEIAAAVASVIQLNASRITAGTINTDRLNSNEIASRVATVIQLNADRITSGLINTDRLNVNEIAARSATFQTVDVKNLFVTTGTMSEAVINKLWADVVMSRKMTTQMLAIGAFDNLITDPNFTNAANDWGTPSSVYSFPSNEGRGGGSALKIAASSSQVGRYSQRIPTIGGEVLRVTVWAKSDVDVPANRIGIYRNQTTPTNTAVHSPANVLRQSNGAVGNDAFPANTWSQLAVEVQVPEGVTSIVIGFFVQSTFSTGTMWFSDASAVRMSGGELIVDGAITAQKIAANAIESDKIKANAITGDKIEAGAIDGKIITGATIQTDNAENTGVKLTNTGIQAYSPEGEKTLSITGGRGVDFMGIWGNENATVDEETGNIIYPAGVEPEQVASLNHEGEITGTALSIGGDARLDGTVIMGGEALHPNAYGLESPGDLGPVIMGRSTVGTGIQGHFDVHPGASTQTSWLDGMPFGLVARGWRGAAGMSVTNQESEILELSYENVSSRAYRITVMPWSVYLNAGALAFLNIYRTYDGTRPTMRDDQLFLRKALRNQSSGTVLMDLGGVFYDVSMAGGTVKYLLTLQGEDAPVTVLGNNANGGGFRVWVEDMGLIAGDTATDRTNVRSIGSTTPAPKPTDPVKPPQKKSYTKTWNASWWGTYWASGGKTTPNSYFDNSGKVTQGNPPGVGLQRGAIGFPNMTSTLSGSTIKKVEVYVYAAHWYANSGGTLQIGTHGHTSKPSSWSGGTTGVKSQKLAKPEGRWVTLPTSVHAGVLGGSVRGIQVYTSSTGSSYYGYLTGSKSKIRVTYEK